MAVRKAGPPAATARSPQKTVAQTDWFAAGPRERRSRGPTFASVRVVLPGTPGEDGIERVAVVRVGAPGAGELRRPLLGRLAQRGRDVLRFAATKWPVLLQVKPQKLGIELLGKDCRRRV